MDYNCLRCGDEMRYVSREFIRLSPQTLLESLAVENLETDIYVCPKCRKIEFFATDCLVPPLLMSLRKQSPVPAAANSMSTVPRAVPIAGESISAVLSATSCTMPMSLFALIAATSTAKAGRIKRKTPGSFDKKSTANHPKG